VLLFDLIILLPIVALFMVNLLEICNKALIGFASDKYGSLQLLSTCLEQ